MPDRQFHADLRPEVLSSVGLEEKEKSSGKKEFGKRREKVKTTDRPVFPLPSRLFFLLSLPFPVQTLEAYEREQQQQSPKKKSSGASTILRAVPRFEADFCRRWFRSGVSRVLGHHYHYQFFFVVSGTWEQKPAHLSHFPAFPNSKTQMHSRPTRPRQPRIRSIGAQDRDRDHNLIH